MATCSPSNTSRWARHRACSPYSSPSCWASASSSSKFENAGAWPVRKMTALPGSRRRHARKMLLNAARYLGILAVLLIFILPFLWMALNSFKVQIDITNAKDIFHFTPTLGNYRNAFEQHNYLLYLVNTFVVAAASTLLSLVLGLPAAYGIARFRTTWLAALLLPARIVPGS